MGYFEPVTSVLGRGISIHLIMQLAEYVIRSVGFEEDTLCDLF